MAVRSAQEITSSLKSIFGEQTPDGYLELLEDITDSVQVPDMSGYVPKADYDKVVTERDAFQNQAQDMRQRYINRFYSDYNEPNSKAYIEGSAPQGQLEQMEKTVTYDDLFE